MVLKLKRFLIFFKVTIVSILAIYFVEQFNLLAAFFPFNPSFLFSACLAIYTGAISCVVDTILEWYDESMRSTVELVFFLDAANKSITNNPNVMFRDWDIAEIKLEIHLKGKKNNFQNLKIIIPYNNFYDVQFSKNYRNLCIKQKDNILINLSEFNISSSKTNTFMEFSIQFIKSSDSPINELECRPSLKGEKMFSIQRLLCKFKHNYFVLKDRGD